MNKFFGIATFSKYPIVNSYNKQFSNDNSNQFTFTDIQKEQDTIRIYNAHLGSIRFNHTDYKVIGGKGSPIWPHQQSPKEPFFQKLKWGLKKRINTRQKINYTTLKIVLTEHCLYGHERYTFIVLLQCF